MPRMWLALTVSAMLLGTACLPKETILPDRRIPHRLASPATVEVWVRRPDGSLVKERIRAEAGWWIAAPEVVEPAR